jgi:Na+/proline symporter
MLTTKQKLALRRKMKFEFYYFLAFVAVFLWSLYGRRTVRHAFELQNALSTAFVEEEFGDYNEKTCAWGTLAAASLPTPVLSDRA